MWGNQGGFGGNYEQSGGFMTSPGPSQEKKTRLRAQNIIPCTIAQIVKATQNDDTFKIGDVEAHQITIVGLIKSMKAQSTNITYEIEDCTGPTIEVKQWIESDNVMEEDLPKENTYVRIFGNIRSLNNKRHIVAFRIRPLSDINELTTHLLEVVHTSMSIVLAEKGLNQPHHSNLNQSMGASSTMSHSLFLSNPSGGLSGLNKQVFDFIASCTDIEEGLSIAALCQKLRTIPPMQIRNSLDFLSQEGHIYSTIDEEHFRCTDS